MSIRVRVAGVSFAPGYPNNLLDLITRLDTEGPILVDLVRDLDNAYDMNAVAVHIEGRPFGHLPANIAASVAPQLDAGTEWSGRVIWMPVDMDHRDRPGLEIDILRS